MCEPQFSWYETAERADSLIREIRVPLTKALDPTEDEDFVLMTARLARKLERERRALVKEDIDKELASLDLDWNNLPPTVHAAVLEAVNLAIRRSEMRVLPAVVAEIGTTYENVAQRSAERFVDKYAFAIGASTDLIDPNVAAAANRAGVFFRDEMGRRALAMSERGRQIIEAGLSQGLRSDAITKDLIDYAKKVHFKRSEHYMRIVAMNATSSARAYGTLRSLSEAGIERYIFTAVMDERTTEVCSMLDGTRFSTAAALSRSQQLIDSQDPADVYDLSPWSYERRNPRTGLKEIFVKNRLGIETRLGVINKPSLGQVNSRGSYSEVLSPAALEAVGAASPPLHGLCRSTLVPDL